MSPTTGDPLEVEGVLNAVAGRGPDDELNLLPRLVGTGNVSARAVREPVPGPRVARHRHRRPRAQSLHPGVILGAFPGTTRLHSQPPHSAYGDELGPDLNLRQDRDTAFFADPIAAPAGRLSLAELRRPMGPVAATDAGDSVEPLWGSETHESIYSLFVFHRMADTSITVHRIVRSA